MKIRPNSLFLTSLLLALTAATHAATIQWVGDADANFANGANWATDPDLPSASADTWQVNTEGDFGTTLTVDSDPLTEGNQALAFTGTAGKIAFGASAPAMTLTGGDLSFFKGTGDTILLGTGSTVTQTVQNKLILGDGSATTMSVTNQSITGGLLKITGNITPGTGGTGGANVISFGSTASNNGNYEITGNISKGATATTIGITKRGSGTLTFKGANEVISLGQNEGGGSIVIAGGKTSILQSGNQQNWGGNRQDNSVKITAGELYANDASGLRSRIEIDGGILTISSATSAGGMYWDVQLTAPGEVFTLKSGTVNFDAALTSGYLRGFRLQANATNQTISGSQTGGNFYVSGGSSAGNVFTVGNTAATYTNNISSYSLSGGVLDLKGQNGSSQGFLQLNAEATSTSTTTFTLSGTGKLISRFNPGAASGGIVGGVVGGVQVLSLQGGRLVAGRVDATNLRGPNLEDAAGTIVNNGSTIAPGDVGSSGKTTVIGNLTITSGSLAFDIGGTAAATAWQDAAGAGNHDKLAATGTGVVVLGGTLNVSLIDSYEPDNGDVFYIIDGGDVSGTFSNLVGGRIILSGGDSFAVTIEGTSVFLSDYQPAGVGGNIAPTISEIANPAQFPSGGNTGALAFTITDEDAASVTPSGSSSNTTLVPNGNISFGGSGANRTVTVTPVSGLSGSATITKTDSCR